MAFLSSSSLHPEMRPAGVMFGAIAVNGSMSSTTRPASSCPATGPSGPSGVWQLPQPMMPRTRYSPRSAGVSACAVPAIARTAIASGHVVLVI
jgi:hypothetical protein